MIFQKLSAHLSLLLIWTLSLASLSPLQAQQPEPKPSDLVGVWFPDRQFSQLDSRAPEELKKYWIQSVEISQSGNKLILRATIASGATKVYEGEAKLNVQQGSPSILGGRFTCVSGCSVREELHIGYSEHVANFRYEDLGRGIAGLQWADVDKIPGWSFKSSPEGSLVGGVLWRRTPPVVAKKDDDELGPFRIVLAHDKLFGEERPATAPTVNRESGDTILVDYVPTPAGGGTSANENKPSVTFPGIEGRPVEAPNNRILFLYGNDLPTDQSKTKIEGCYEGEGCDQNIQYFLLGLGAGIEKDKAGEPRDPIWRAAWKKVDQSLTPEQREAFKKSNQMLVEANFSRGPVLGGLKHGFKKFTVNGVARTWFLPQGNARAEIRFVRATGTRSSQGAEVFEDVDTFYVPERLYIEVRTSGFVDLEEIPLNLLKNGVKITQAFRMQDKPTDKPQTIFEPRTIMADFVSSQVYRTKAIDFVPPNSMIRSDSARLRLEAGVPVIFTAVPEDDQAMASAPAVAQARDGIKTNPVWIQALQIAAHNYPCLNSACRRIPLGKSISSALSSEYAAREEDYPKSVEDLRNNKLPPGKPLTDSEAAELRVELTKGVARDVIREKLDADKSVADVRLGHLAAMIFLKQVFIEMMEAYKAKLPKIVMEDYKSNLPKIEGYVMVRSFRDLIAPIVYADNPKSPSFAFTGIRVTREGYEEKVTLRDALFELPYYGRNKLDVSNYLRPTWRDPGSAAPRYLYSNRDEYTFLAVKEALGYFTKAIDQALANAKAIKDDDLDKLLALTGFGFGAVVKQVQSRMMKFDESNGRWVPDDVARRWVDEVAVVANKFEAQGKIEEAERQIFLLVLGLVPVLAPQSLLARIVVNAIFVGDVAVNTIPEYIRQDEEVKLALGASGVLGTERLNTAQLQKMPDWALFIAVAGAGLGIVADLPEVLKFAGAGGHEAEVLAKVQGKGLAEFKLLPKDEQAEFLAAAARDDLKKAAQGENALTDAERSTIAKFESLGKETESGSTAAESITKAGTLPPKTTVALEEAKSAAGKISEELKVETAKGAAADKNLIKDLEIRKDILNELGADANKLAQVSKDDLAFLLNPTRDLIAGQEKEVLDLILDKWKNWNDLKKAFNSVPSKVSKIEMYKVIKFRTQTVENMLDEILKEVSAQTGVTLERKALGSVTLTSDFDISVEGYGAERVVKKFNEKFRGDPRFKGLESGTVFDTNVYTDPVYKLFKGKLANGQSLALEPAQLDELKQLMYDNMATRKYSSAADWKAYVDRLLAGAPSDEMRNVLKYATDAAEEAHLRARDLIAKRLRGINIFDREKNKVMISVAEANGVIEAAEPNALLRATNEVYGEAVLSDIDKLRVESKRLEGLGSESKLEDYIPDPRASELLGNTDYKTSLKKIEGLIKQGGPEAQSIIVDIKAQLQELIAKQARAKQGTALYFASEAYQTEGAIAHVVGELQEAGRKINLQALLDNAAGKAILKEGKLDAGLYLNSFSENRANMFKELAHALHGANPDLRYAAAKAGKYFVRQLDAMQQAGVRLQGSLTEDIIGLTVGIAKDKDKLELVQSLLDAKGISAKKFIEEVEHASNDLKVKALGRSPVKEKASEISKYLNDMDPNLAKFREGDVPGPAGGGAPKPDKPSSGNAGEPPKPPEEPARPGNPDEQPTKGDPGKPGPTEPSKPGPGANKPGSPRIGEIVEGPGGQKFLVGSNGQKLLLGEKIGEGRYATVYDLKDGTDRVVKVYRKPEGSGTAIKDVMSDIKTGSDLLEKHHIPQPKTFWEESHLEVDMPFILQEKVVSAGKFATDFTDEMGEAVAKLYRQFADEHVAWEDGHINNIFFKKEGNELVAGVLDVDNIGEWDKLSARVAKRIEDYEYAPSHTGINSLPGFLRPGIKPDTAGHLFPSAEFYMEKMFEAKGWIEYVPGSAGGPGKFVKKLIDPEMIQKKYFPNLSKDSGPGAGKVTGNPPEEVRLIPFPTWRLPVVQPFLARAA